MKLYKILNIELNEKAVISVVGGGGKTTTIETLAKELSHEGKSVLITTSTAIFIPQRGSYDDFFVEDIPSDFSPKPGTITYFAETKDKIKLKTNDISLIDRIITKKIFDFILIEADGSKGKPIKAPGPHEPVISQYTTITIGVIGMDSIDTIIDEENVHRSDLFLELLRKDIKFIDNNAIIKLILSDNGLFKNSIGRKIVLLNKVKNNSRIKHAEEIKLKLKYEDISIVIGDVQTNTYEK